MNADITVKAKVYKLAYSDKSGSLRTSTTDGAAFPHSLSIVHQPLVDGKSKLPMIQSKLFISMTHKDTGGVNPAAAPVTVQVTTRLGTGLNAPSQAEILLALDSARQILASTAADASALDLGTNIFVTQEQ